MRHPGAGGRRRTELAIAALSVGGAGVLLRFARTFPNFVCSDDGYFYAQIAYELGTTGRSTFDGIHTTSGYHLAWGLLLGALSRALAVFTLDKSVHLFAYLAASLYLTLTTARRRFTTVVGRIAAVTFILGGFSLTEMVLATPLALAIVDRASVRDDYGRRAGDLVLAAALPFVRIDLVVVPLVVALWLGLVRRRSTDAARVAAAALAGALVQLGAMKLAFGHFVSVAASLKFAPPTPSSVVAMAAQNAFGSAGNVSRLVTVAALAAVPWLGRAARPKGDTALVVAASLAFLALHFFVTPLRDWYWLPSELGLLLVAERATVACRPAELAVGAFAAIQLGRMVHLEVVNADDQARSTAFLGEVKARVPTGGRNLQYDGSGFFGYFSERSVIDGDGLVNDYDYARRLRGGSLAGYLEEERVCWVVTDLPYDDRVFDMGGLVVRRDDVRMVYGVHRRSFAWGEFALHALRAPRCQAAVTW